jgi:hypothetical protein
MVSPERHLVMKKETLFIGVIVIFFACGYVRVPAAPQRKVAARKKVKVYFYHDPGEYIDLAPVTRSVNANSEAVPDGAAGDCFT